MQALQCSVRLSCYVQILPCSSCTSALREISAVMHTAASWPHTKPVLLALCCNSTICRQPEKCCGVMLVDALLVQSGALLILWQLFEMWCAALQMGAMLQQTFTVSASAELGASSELLLSPGPFPIRKLTSRSLSQLLPPSACMTERLQLVKVRPDRLRMGNIHVSR